MKIRMSTDFKEKNMKGIKYVFSAVIIMIAMSSVIMFYKIAIYDIGKDEVIKLRDMRIKELEYELKICMEVKRIKNEMDNKDVE